MSFSSESFITDTQNSSSTYTDTNGKSHNNIDSLTRAWMNERSAPELLPYKKQLVDSLIGMVEEQANMVMDEMTSSLENKFASMVYQTELERIRYLIKSYLRTRLFKIEKYTLELLRKPNLTKIMSSQEIVYARRYQELVETHNFESFLKHMPATQHKQDEKTGELNMIVTANLEAPVFCRVLEDIGEIQWVVGKNRMETTELEKNGTYIIRYRAIEQYLREGRIQLI